MTEVSVNDGAQPLGLMLGIGALGRISAAKRHLDHLPEMQSVAVGALGDLLATGETVGHDRGGAPRDHLRRQIRLYLSGHDGTMTWAAMDVHARDTHRDEQACAGLLSSFAAENASSWSPARAVTHTMLPSEETTTRTGEQCGARACWMTSPRTWLLAGGRAAVESPSHLRTHPEALRVTLVAALLRAGAGDH